MSSLGTWPTGIDFTGARLMNTVNQRAHISPGQTSEQVIDLIGDRWMLYITVPGGNHVQGAVLEAWLGQFRGMVNWASLWHPARRVPRGTLRGTPTIHTTAAAGARSVILQAAAAETLYAGDMLGSDGLLLQTASDCTADGSGVITVPLNNALRWDLDATTAVVWDKPTAPFRLMSSSGVEFLRGRHLPVDLVLAEKVDP